MTFSSAGVGRLLAKTFNKAINGRPIQFPCVSPRGRTLLLAADFGGQHKGPHFETYAFLILDLDRNTQWLEGQRHFRSHVLPNRRRMSFKAMNDSQRRDALVSFLDLAHDIEGWLVLFAISKNGISLFSDRDEDPEANALLSGWKPAVQERLMRILHLSAFLVSGLSVPGQNLLWFIDEDDVAANVDQLTQLTALFAQVASHYLPHSLGHIRCGTARSDDGSLSLEDLVAISDLSAGAFCEIATDLVRADRFPRQGVFTPVPAGQSWKNRVMATWLAGDGGELLRLPCIIDLSPSTMRASIIKMQTTFGPLLLPRDPFVYKRG